MKKETRIEIATVVFYDGVEAYTTHRALFVDCSDKMKLTRWSKTALKYDIEERSGCEILKIDFNNGQTFSDASDFLKTFKTLYRCTDNDVEYIRDKFIEYFIVNDWV